MALILEGRQVAAGVKARLQEKVEALRQQGIQCGLAVVRVGDDPASRVYTNALVKLAGNIGLRADVRTLPGDMAEPGLLAVLGELNRDPGIHGILPMMPLPRHLDPDKVAETICPDKDVDSLHPLNVGLVAAGKSRWAPCTPRAVMTILDHYSIKLEGKKVAIVGRSNVVGKPLFQLMLARNATVTVCHSKTPDLVSVVRAADVVVAAVGRPEMIGAAMIKPGAVVVDVGINEVGGRLVGDVEFAAVEPVARAITPVPGGVGAVSNVMVMEAVLRHFAG
ncbi:MAG TPA: tetrahydrofolate dehydrogenase/cyclohydrolase catalytic domain-containing protein [Selenomonadales bacterium]|nr:tetrahydrofolate dehydrogenase/cyclohydrolase catalytic domain-containing protein [Selenomonadales bacterium]